MEELITTNVAGWRRGAIPFVARHLACSLYSFNKISHLIAKRNDVDTLSFYGFKWVEGSKDPVYYTIELENVEIKNKNIIKKINKASEVLESAISDTDDEVLQNIIEELVEFVEEPKMASVVVVKHQNGKEEVKVEEKTILLSTISLSYILAELDFKEIE